MDPPKRNEEEQNVLAAAQQPSHQDVETIGSADEEMSSKDTKVVIKHVPPPQLNKEQSAVEESSFSEERNIRNINEENERISKLMFFHESFLKLMKEHIGTNGKPDMINEAADRLMAAYKLEMKIDDKYSMKTRSSLNKNNITDLSLSTLRISGTNNMNNLVRENIGTLEKLLPFEYRFLLDFQNMKVEDISLVLIKVGLCFYPEKLSVLLNDGEAPDVVLKNFIEKFSNNSMDMMNYIQESTDEMFEKIPEFAESVTGVNPLRVSPRPSRYRHGARRTGSYERSRRTARSISTSSSSRSRGRKVGVVGSPVTRGRSRGKDISHVKKTREERTKNGDLEKSTYTYSQF